MKKLGLLAVLAACGGGDPRPQDPTPPVETPAAEEAPAREIPLEAFRHEAEGVVVEVQKPVGWQRATHLGPTSASFVDPDSLEAQQSNFGVAINCGGWCDKKGENLAGSVDEMVASWEKYEGYTAKFLAREELPGGGRADEIEFSHAELGPIYFYQRIHVVGDGLPFAWCKVQLAGPALPLRDQLKAACAAMTATASGQ